MEPEGENSFEQLEETKTDVTAEYVELLDLLYRVVEANKGPSTSPDDRGWYAEGLVAKFFFHALSVLYLSRGTNVPDLPSINISKVDPASVEVLIRAALETFLTFHYVFFAPKKAEERDYRYWAWRVAGYKERQGLLVSTTEHRQKLAEGKKELDNLDNKLRANAAFQRLGEKEKKRVLKGEWKLASWRDIATDAGFGRLLASDMYRHLSGYAHSSSLSVLQIKQSLLRNEQRLLIETSMITINIVAANLIHKYCELFLRARGVWDTDPRGREIVGQWIYFGQNLDPEVVD